MTELEQWIQQLDLLVNVNVYYLVPNTELNIGLRMVLSYTNTVAIFKECEVDEVVCIYLENDKSSAMLSSDKSIANDGGVVQSMEPDTCSIDVENIENEYDSIEGEQG